MDIFCFGFHHVEDDLIPLSHALCMGRADIVLNNDLPLPSTKPATHEALDLHGDSRRKAHGCIKSK